jgi:hypothetical protein
LSRRSVVLVGENIWVAIDHVDDAGCTEHVKVAAGAGADLCFDAARLGAMPDGVAMPILCSYTRESMTAASTEHDCLRVKVA